MVSLNIIKACLLSLISFSNSNSIEKQSSSPKTPNYLFKYTERIKNSTTMFFYLFIFLIIFPVSPYQLSNIQFIILFQSVSKLIDKFWSNYCEPWTLKPNTACSYERNNNGTTKLYTFPSFDRFLFWFGASSNQFLRGSEILLKKWRNFFSISNWSSAGFYLRT